MKRIIGSVDNFPAPLWSEVLSRRSHASLSVDRHPYTLREAHYFRHVSEASAAGRGQVEAAQITLFCMSELGVATTAGTAPNGGSVGLT